jgi:hypothetical protein
MVVRCNSMMATMMELVVNQKINSSHDIGSTDSVPIHSILSRYEQKTCKGLLSSVTSIHFNMLLSSVNPFQRVQMSKFHHLANSPPTPAFRPLLSRYEQQRCKGLLWQRNFNPFQYVLSSVNPIQRVQMSNFVIKRTIPATPALRTRAFTRGLQSRRF